MESDDAERIEDALRVGKEATLWRNRYEAAVDATGHLLYDWDAATNDVVYGGNLEAVLGYAMHEMAGGLARWRGLIHEEDLPLFDGVIEELCASRGHARFVYRVRHKDGRYVYVEDRGRFFVDEEGNPTRMLGFIADVSERYAAESSLRESRQRLQSTLQEKETLLRELYHRTKNNMQVICSMLYMQAEQLPDEHTRRLLKDVENRIHTMALVHEKLYQSASLSSIDLAAYVTDLCALLADSLDARARGIALIVDCVSRKVSLDSAVPCGLVLNELLTNALRHGGFGDRGGEIRVRTHGSVGPLFMEVSDDGVGLPDGFDLHTDAGFGLRIVRRLVEYQLNGTFCVEQSEPRGRLTWRVDAIEVT